MVVPIHQNFRLYEAGQVFTADELISAAERQPDLSAVQIHYADYSHERCLVADSIKGILTAFVSQCDVWLNRTGAPRHSNRLPKGFSIHLQTSGTTGPAKWARHDESLFRSGGQGGCAHQRWLLCYHPMSFAGLNVILHAMQVGAELFVAPFSSVAQKAEMAQVQAINALSATPSILRGLLMTWGNSVPPLAMISCGGEIADQALLDALSARFPQARLRHLYASTEAGVVFSVADRQAGFPKAWLGQRKAGWRLDVSDGELVLARSGKRLYTGDRVHCQGERCLFAGRSDQIANIAGVKVNLAEVEQRLQALAHVRDVRAYAKPSPITGALVALEVATDEEALARLEVEAHFQKRPKVEHPCLVSYSTDIRLSEVGKKLRREEACSTSS